MPGGMPMGTGGFAKLMSGGSMAKTGVSANQGLRAQTSPEAEQAGSWGRRISGAIGGFGQGLMDTDMRRRFDAAGSGGYADLMQKQKIGDFVRTGNRERAGDVLSRGVARNPNTLAIK